MSNKKIKKVTKLADKKKSKKEGPKKPMDPVARKKELEAELQKTLNLLGGLQQRIKETETTAHRIQGALELLKELE